MRWVEQWEGRSPAPAIIGIATLLAAGFFAVFAQLVWATAHVRIAGIFHYETVKPVDPKRVERMSDAIAHRGLTGSGVWTAPGIGLGHRRLSIIDLAGSPQPMHSADERAVIVFNGEIYNYRELRRELEQGGAVFRTDGIQRLSLQPGRNGDPIACVGSTACSPLRSTTAPARRLFLARDRFGVKPLYLARLEGGALAFASE